jgi:hypothetical protein
MNEPTPWSASMYINLEKAETSYNSERMKYVYIYISEYIYNLRKRNL